MDRIQNAVNRAKTIEPQRPQSEAARRAARVGGAVAAEAPMASCDREAAARNCVILNEQDPILSSYRVLRTKVLQTMAANDWTTLAVVSPGSGAGKTVTAINLSIAIGDSHGAPAMLLDLDFYRPSVARYLGVKNAPSLVDYFEYDTPLSEIAFRPELGRCLVAANERVSRRGAEFFASSRMDSLVQEARSVFGARPLIFDMSPLLGCDDSLAILPKVDCVLLVAASGQTRAGEVKEAKRLLQGANLIGSILNKAPSALPTSPYY